MGLGHFKNSYFCWHFFLAEGVRTLAPHPSSVPQLYPGFYLQPICKELASTGGCSGFWGPSNFQLISRDVPTLLFGTTGTPRIDMVGTSESQGKSQRTAKWHCKLWEVKLCWHCDFLQPRPRTNVLLDVPIIHKFVSNHTKRPWLGLIWLHSLRIFRFRIFCFESFALGSFTLDVSL